MGILSCNLVTTGIYYASNKDVCIRKLPILVYVVPIDSSIRMNISALCMFRVQLTVLCSNGKKNATFIRNGIILLFVMVTKVYVL